MRAVGMPAYDATRWTGAHWLGWVVAGAAVGALTLGLGSAPWLICLGWLAEGLLLGAAQALVLRRAGVNAQGWVLVTLLAVLASTALLAALDAALFATNAPLGIQESASFAGQVFNQGLLQGVVEGALSGLALGGAQYLLLRADFHGAMRWIVASVVGAAAGAAAAHLLLWYEYGPALSVNAGFTPLLALAGAAQGGIYGAATATTLPALLRTPRSFARR